MFTIPTIRQRLSLVCEKLKTLLAQNDVEACVRQGDLKSAALKPLKRARPRVTQRRGDFEHSGVQV